MNMYLHELKANRKSTVTWTLSLMGVIVLFLSIYPAFAASAEDFQKLLAGYPPAILDAFGISFTTFFSIIGFYSYVFSYIVLCSSIQGMNLGVSMLSKEVRDKTADFLLSKPVSRTQIMTSKLLAAFTTFTISNAIYIGTAFAVAFIISKESFDYKVFFLISLTAFLIGLMFMALGILVSVVLPKIKSVLSISLSTVFGFFILSMFGSVIGEETIRYLTPFKFFDTVYIMEHGAYEIKFVIIELLFIIAAVVVSYVIYLKKDVQAV